MATSTFSTPESRNRRQDGTAGSGSPFYEGQKSSRINQVPLIGTLKIDLATDVGEVSVVLPDGEKWQQTGRVSELKDELIARTDADVEKELIEFMERAVNDESVTFSPLPLRIGDSSTIVGLSSHAEEVGQIVCSVLDLDPWISTTIRAERQDRVNSTYLRIIEWIEGSQSDSEAWRHILNEFIAFTGNDFGFIGQRQVDDAGQPYLRTFSITNIAWNEETRKLYQENVDSGFVFHNMSALFGPTITRGEVIVSKDYSSDTRGVGLPAGHPPLESYVGLPIQEGTDILGMVGLAGKKGGVSDEDVESCQRVMNMLVRDQRFRRLFGRLDTPSTFSDPDEFSSMTLVLDSLEIPALTMDGDRVTWASMQTAKMFGCLASMLIDSDLAELEKIIGLREENFEEQEPETSDALMDAAKWSHLDRWLSIPLNTERALFHMKHMRISGRDLYQIVDYTYQVRAFRETQEFATKAAEVSQLQSRLVNMISHELRTPLSSLQTSVELMQMKVTEVQKEQFQSYFENIYRMVSQMTSHIDSVLAFGKVAIGREQIELHPTNFEEVLDEVLSELQTEASERVKVLASKTLDSVFLMSDKALLGLALKNIISNALKFSEGPVDLIASIKDDVSTRFAIEIRDRGVGIPTTEITKVFSPFHRAANASRFPGRGIGLALVNGIVKMLEGEIKIDSVERKGTSVFLNLPMVKS